MIRKGDQKANDHVKYVIMKLFRIIISDRKEFLSIGENSWQIETLVINPYPANVEKMVSS